MRQKIQKKTKFEVRDLVRIADIEKMFSKGDTINWSTNYMKLQMILKIQQRVII